MSDNTIRITDDGNEPDSILNLAIERTQLALERTHLAWIRTMFTLITAGLAIDKGIAYIHEKRIASGTALVANAHIIGLILTIAGTLLLLFESIYFARRNRTLAKMKKGKFYFLSAGGILSSLVILLGLMITILIIITK